MSEREPVSIEIAICTWNRCQLLDGCLATLCAMNVEATTKWSVLIVDNNSTDATAEVVAGYAERLPVRRIVEEKQGLSHARNRALEVCSADYVLWTDDDVRVPANWVDSYARAIVEHGYPAVLGGGIFPDFGADCPRWLQKGWEHVANAFAVRRSPGAGISIEKGYYPFGANFCIRRDVLKTGAFDPALGRVGAKMLSGEEEAVISEVLSDPNNFGVWLGDADVRHLIEPYRQKLQYLKAYFAGHGEVLYRIEAASEVGPPRSPRRMLLSMYRAALRRYLQYLRSRFQSDSRGDKCAQEDVAGRAVKCTQ